MELDELQKELQKYKDLRDKAIKDGTDFGWINETIAGLEVKIAALSGPDPASEQAQEVVQPVEQPVEEEFKLPVDYNAIFRNPHANEEIMNLILQVKSQLTKENEADLEKIYAMHKQKISELQVERDHLQEIVNVGKPENERLTLLVEDQALQIKQLTIDKKDAEQKRDNAVKLQGEAEATSAKLLQENAGLNGQIDELEILVHTYKKPTAFGGLSLTTTLKPETDAEKQARLENEKTDLLNKNLVRFNVDPLPTKDVLVTKDELDTSFRSVAEGATVSSNVAGGDSVSEAAAAVDPAAHETATPTLEQLHAEVNLLKTQMDNVLNHLFDTTK